MLAVHGFPSSHDGSPVGSASASNDVALSEPSLLSASRPLHLQQSGNDTLQHAPHSLGQLHEAGSSATHLNGCDVTPYLGHSSVASSSDAASPDSLFTTATDEQEQGATSRSWSFDEHNFGARQTNFDELAMDFAQSAASAWVRDGEVHAVPTQQQQYDEAMFRGNILGGVGGEKPLLTAEDITTAQLREMAPFLRVPALQEHFEYEQSAVAAPPFAAPSYPDYQYASSFRSDTPSVGGYSTVSAADSAYSHASLSRDASFSNVQHAMPSHNGLYVQGAPLERQMSAQSARTSSSVGGREKSTKSHSRKRPEGHIKRPMNAFFLFRKHVSDYNLIPKNFVVNDQRAISRIIACMWQNLPSTWQDEWRKQYQREKEAFHAAHPDYKYKPDTDAASKKAKRTLQSEHLQQEECKEIADQIFMSFQAPKDNAPTSKKAGISKGANAAARAADGKTPRRKKTSKKSTKEALHVSASMSTDATEPSDDGSSMAAPKGATKASRAKRGTGKGGAQKMQIKEPDSANSETVFRFQEPVTVPSQPEHDPFPAFAHTGDNAFDLPTNIPDAFANDNSLLIQDWGEGLAVEARRAAENNQSPVLSQGSLPNARSFRSQPLSFSSPIRSSFESTSPGLGGSTLKRRKLPPPHLQLIQRQTAMPRASPRTMSFSGMPSASRPSFGPRSELIAPTTGRMDMDVDLDRQRPHTMATPREAVFKIWPKSNLDSTLLSPTRTSAGEMRRGSAMPGSALFSTFGRAGQEPQTAKDADISHLHAMAQDLATGSGWTPIRAHFGLDTAGLNGAFPQVRRMSSDEQRQRAGTSMSAMEAALALSPRAVASELLEPLTARPGANFFSQGADVTSPTGQASADALASSFRQLVSPTSATLSLHGSVPDFDFSVPTPRTARPPASQLAASVYPPEQDEDVARESVLGLVAAGHSRSDVSGPQTTLPHAIDTDMDTSASSDATLRTLAEALSAPAASSGNALSQQQRMRRQRDDSYDVFHFNADFLETAQHDAVAGGEGATRPMRATSLPPEQ